jgi:hypothetical protein
VDLALAYLLVGDGSNRAVNVPTFASAEQPTDAMPLFSSDVLALQIEDHYIRVHRPEGSQLVLMTLGQGIAALDGLEGLRTPVMVGRPRSGTACRARDEAEAVQWAGGPSCPICCHILAGRPAGYGRVEPPA